MHHMHADVSGQQTTASPLQPIRVRELFEVLGMDIVGELPRTVRGNQWILVMIDHHTKWAVGVPLASITTQAVADALLKFVVLAEHGAPRRILTDRGSNFNSALAQEVSGCYLSPKA